jgi:DNA-binding protein H-NS
VTQRDGTDSRKGEAKYQNPDPSAKSKDQFWTGRGHMPKWMRYAIEAGKGKTKEDFLINK